MARSTHKWWVLFTLCLLTVMLNVDVTAANLAIPAIAHDLQASLVDLQWVINAFVLVSAMFQIFGGRFGDMVGHRRTFIGGTILFILSSALAGMATSEFVLITARALQGLSLGLAYPMTMSIIYKNFSEEQQGIAVGILMGAMGFSLALGPTIGGLILDYLDWRWIFLVNVPLGLLTVALSFLMIPKDSKIEEKIKIDYIGSCFLTLGLLGIILALNQAQTWGIDSSLFWTVFLAGWLSIAILFRVERNIEHRIIDFSLFSISNFSLNTLLRVIAQMVFLSCLFFIPIYLQNIVSIDPIKTGLYLLFLTVITGIISPLAGKWIDRVGTKIPNIVAMSTYAAGCAALALLNTSLNLSYLIIGLVLVGLGTAINFVSTTNGALSACAKEQTGLASGVFFTIVWAACALGVAVTGIIIKSVGNTHLTMGLKQLSANLTTQQASIVERISSGISPITTMGQYFSGEKYEHLQALASKSFIAGFSDAFILLTVLSVLGIGIAFFTKK